MTLINAPTKQPVLALVQHIYYDSYTSHLTSGPLAAPLTPQALRLSAAADVCVRRPDGCVTDNRHYNPYKLSRFYYYASSFKKKKKKRSTVLVTVQRNEPRGPKRGETPVETQQK